jgi:hypothetical protein
MFVLSVGKKVADVQPPVQPFLYIARQGIGRHGAIKCDSLVQRVNHDATVIALSDVGFDLVTQCLLSLTVDVQR